MSILDRLFGTKPAPTETDRRPGRLSTEPTRESISSIQREIASQHEMLQDRSRQEQARKQRYVDEQAQLYEYFSVHARALLERFDALVDQTNRQIGKEIITHHELRFSTENTHQTKKEGGDPGYRVEFGVRYGVEVTRSSLYGWFLSCYWPPGSRVAGAAYLGTTEVSMQAGKLPSMGDVYFLLHAPEHGAEARWSVCILERSEYYGNSTIDKYDLRLHLGYLSQFLKGGGTLGGMWDASRIQYRDDIEVVFQELLRRLFR